MGNLAKLGELGGGGAESVISRVYLGGGAWGGFSLRRSIVERFYSSYVLILGQKKRFECAAIACVASIVALALLHFRRAYPSYDPDW